MFNFEEVELITVIIALISSIITAAATIYAAKYGVPQVQEYVKESSCMVKLAIIMIAPFVTLAFIVFVFFAFLTAIGFLVGKSVS